jgi:SulP family sulfate permease
MAAPPLLARLFPFLRWWPKVTRDTLRADLLAGLVGAVVVLPQGVAFAAIAGLPPQYGLYAAMVPAVVAALFGSSWHAVTGPTTAVSLVVFATLAPLAAPGSAAYVQYALTLSFLSGLVMLAMGLARLGALVNFISHTVVVGFTAGAALLIAASQLGNFSGVAIERGLPFASTLAAFVRNLGQASPWVVIVAAATLASGLLARRVVPRVPYMLVAMIAGSIVALVLDYLLGPEQTRIRTLGALPGALPPLSAPELAPETVRRLAPIALAVTLLGLTEAVSISRAIALRSGQRIDGSQEFIGQGLANIAASFFSGYPASASFNRSGLNFEAGARTPLAAVFASVLLAVVVLAVGPLVAFLPVASMAAILFLVAWGLIDLRAIRKIVRASRSETAVLATTLAATLLIDLEYAIIAGVTLSLLLYLGRTSHPPMRSIAPDPRHALRKMSNLDPGVQECPQLKILRIEGSIYFGAVDYIGRHFDTLEEVAPGQKHLLLMAKGINFIDVAGAELLGAEAHRRRAMGGALHLCSLRQPVRDLLDRSGYLAVIRPENVYSSTGEALAGAFERLDREVCARCHARIFLECRTLPPPVAGPAAGSRLAEAG